VTDLPQQGDATPNALTIGRRRIAISRDRDCLFWQLAIDRHILRDHLAGCNADACLREGNQRSAPIDKLPDDYFLLRNCETITVQKRWSAP
jgi:hypothetical protein